MGRNVHCEVWPVVGFVFCMPEGSSGAGHFPGHGQPPALGGAAAQR